jgi:hypothetical protein
MAAVRAAGIAFEVAAGIASKKEAIYNLASGALRRYPDALDRVNGVLEEAKNSAYVYLSPQISDYADWVQRNGYDFILKVRSDTILSAPLQDLFNSNPNFHIVNVPFP